MGALFLQADKWLGSNIIERKTFYIIVIKVILPLY